MKVFFALVLGLTLTVAFTAVFYRILDKLPSFTSAASEKVEPTEKVEKAPPPAPLKPVSQTKEIETTGSTTVAAEIAKHTADARRDLAKIEARSVEIAIESQNLATEKNNLKRTIASDNEFKDIFADLPTFPKDARTRDTLMKIASAIINVGSAGKFPFARLSVAQDKILIYLNARNLFGNIDTKTLSVPEEKRLVELVDTLPRNFTLQKVSVYEAIDVPASPGNDIRMKNINMFLRRSLGAKVQEIQVRMIRSDLIPGHMPFTLELSGERRGDSTAVNTAAVNH